MGGLAAQNCNPAGGYGTLQVGGRPPPSARGKAQGTLKVTSEGSGSDLQTVRGVAAGEAATGHNPVLLVWGPWPWEA